MKLKQVKDDIDKFFDSLTQEELQERWKKYEHLDNVGVTVNDFLDWNQKNNPNWKTKTTGVCNFQKCPYTHYAFMNNQKVQCTVCGNLVGGNNITC
jgi:hypothetical protein